MKFIAMSPFLLVGIFVGLLINHLFKNSRLSKFSSIILGITGAFIGLFLKDIFDWHFIGNYSGAAVVAFVGAALITTTAHLLSLKK